MASERDPPLLHLIGVTKEYPTAPGAPALRVLAGIDLVVGAGESLAVVGASGSGKSTLLNLIGTLDRPTAGRILLDGRDLATLSDDALARVRNAEIGFVFQLHHLLPQCTALENVLLPTIAATGKPPRGAEERARRLLARVGLAERSDRFPGQLSGGERQRVAVVRALINRPRLLLADEPTGALDRRSAEALADLLVELNREEGVALIVVTHAMALTRRMGRVLELRDGTLAPVTEAAWTAGDS